MEQTGVEALPISFQIQSCSKVNYKTCQLQQQREKVVFVLGSTGAGKSKLAIDLAAHFGGEVVNSDKMQVYDGLDVITNKVTPEESGGVPHHLIGGVHPAADFTAADFRREAMKAIAAIVARGRVPIVAGGSNTYVEHLVDSSGDDRDDQGSFRSKYECCFIWIEVDLPVLDPFVSARVDTMVEKGLIDEARSVFDPTNSDYSKGVRRAIGVPEMHRYFGVAGSSDAEKEQILKEAISEVKANTVELIKNQLEKIRRLCSLPGWDIHRIDATEAFEKRGSPEFPQAWNAVARDPSIAVVEQFLNNTMSLCGSF